VIADLLSTDAVQISTGASVRIDGWGGRPIRGPVTRVDPAGFLKVSAPEKKVVAPADSKSVRLTEVFDAEQLKTRR
jgi:hypothetical protein